MDYFTIIYIMRISATLVPGCQLRPWPCGWPVPAARGSQGRDGPPRLAAMRAVLLLLALLLPAAARAEAPPVDVALVLAVDASGSISHAEFELQKQGIAQAVTSARVLRAIQGGQLRRIAIAYVEWGGPGNAQTIVSWHLVEDAASAAAFAQAVVEARRSAQGYNAIGDAILHGAALLATCPCEALRRVIDISGDNSDRLGRIPAPAARDQAVAAGITVNALAILQNDLLGPRGKPLLVESYENEVIGGPGAFVLPAESREAFTEALLDKMVLEISGLQPAPGALQSAGP
jgi:hypothetical protein